MRDMRLLLVLLAMSAAMPAAEANLHLYLLIGQSNMAGRGAVDAESAQAHPRVLMLTKDLRWVPAIDPLHFDKAGAGVGPGLAFAKRMAEADSRARIGLIPCAVGGTAIRVWEPGAADAATKTHPYDDMRVRLTAALPAGTLKGVLWHQGEANRGDAATYGASLRALVERVRRDAGAPEVPFVAGELSAFRPEVEAATTAFNAALRAIAPPIPRFAVVSAAGMQHKGDRLHYDAASARVLGGRYAEAMLKLQLAR